MNNEKIFDKLINKLTNECIKVLEYQYRAGATVLMIFDTWSNMIPDVYWKKYAINPVHKIIGELRRRQVICPIIGSHLSLAKKLFNILMKQV